tara:strand:- start:21689 stop:23983 length:2295 start_codon:yes stop_codon:yes gene_type:complete
MGLGEKKPAAEPEVTNNNKISRKFLKTWAKEGPWVLTAINSERHGIQGKVIQAEDKEGLEKFLEECATNNRNVYFHVNTTHDKVKTKASKEDVKYVTHFHVDIDPRAGEDVEAEQERILELARNPPEGIPYPTWINYSGGGYQLFWELNEPIDVNYNVEAAEKVELYNIRLEVLYKADNCHNVDRIMRLPGSVNCPDEKKRRRGRTRAMADVIEFHEKNVYKVSDFTPATSSVKPGAGNKNNSPKVDLGNIERADSIETLKGWAKDKGKTAADWFGVVVVQGDNPEKPYESRSDALFAVCCEMVRLEFTDTQMYSVITDPDFGISASVLDKGSSIQRYAKRQIERARETVGGEFDTDKHDKPIAKSPRNIRLAIGKLGVTLRNNLLSGNVEIYGLDRHGPALTDVSEGALILTIEKNFKFLPPENLVRMVMADLAHNDSYHPIVDELDRLQKLYKGGKSLETWLIDVAGVKDTPLNREFSRLMLLALVRRVRRPGCKFDFMPVFEGAQGTQKSSLLRILAIKDEWFSDSFSLKASADPKLVIEQTRGHWIVEVAELDGINKAGVEDIKGMLSRQSDRGRMAYARHAIEVLRQWVGFGTTNSVEWLKDPTGNRRFWPILLGLIDLVKFAAMRDQLWAEAATVEATGVPIQLDPKLYAAATEAQSERLSEHPFVDTFREYLGDKEGLMPLAEAWKILGIHPKDQTRNRNRDLGSALRSLGWRKVQKSSIEGFSSRWAWEKTSDPRSEDPSTRILILGPSSRNSDEF